MDKMAESANVVSLIGNTKTEDGARNKTTTVEGDTFSKVLEKKTGRLEETADRARESMSSDKPSDKAREKTQQQAQLEERLKGKLSMKPADMTMANYLYNIVLRNPDSMSLSEKQTFQVGEFSREGVGVKEFQKMLQERGIHLRDLSMTQLAQLTQRNNKPQITAFLNDLLRQMRDGTGDGLTSVRLHSKSVLEATVKDAEATESPTSRDEKARQVAERRGGELRQPEQPQANLGVVPPQAGEADRPHSTENQSRKEERENVIRQIIERMEIQTVGRRTDLTLKLNPEYLGDMRVKLSTENGKLQASFETTSREVRDFIEEGWEGLRDTFTRKGLNLTKVTATLVESV